MRKVKMFIPKKVEIGKDMKEGNKA